MELCSFISLHLDRLNQDPLVGFSAAVLPQVRKLYTQKQSALCPVCHGSLSVCSNCSVCFCALGWSCIPYVGRCVLAITWLVSIWQSHGWLHILGRSGTSVLCDRRFSSQCTRLYIQLQVSYSHLFYRLLSGDPDPFWPQLMFGLSLSVCWTASLHSSNLFEVD